MLGFRGQPGGEGWQADISWTSFPLSRRQDLELFICTAKERGTSRKSIIKQCGGSRLCSALRLPPPTGTETKHIDVYHNSCPVLQVCTY